jgi:hypothetical protein
VKRTIHPNWLDPLFWQDVAIQVKRLDDTQLRAKAKRVK